MFQPWIHREVVSLCSNQFAPSPPFLPVINVPSKQASVSTLSPCSTPDLWKSLTCWWCLMIVQPGLIWDTRSNQGLALVGRHSNSYKWAFPSSWSKEWVTQIRGMVALAVPWGMSSFLSFPSFVKDIRFFTQDITNSSETVWAVYFCVFLFALRSQEELAVDVFVSHSNRLLVSIYDLLELGTQEIVSSRHQEVMGMFS